MKYHLLLATAALVFVSSATAQQSTATTGAAPTPPRSLGLTVLGDKESPLGVSIVPWRNSAAQGAANRPARLLNEALLPLDPDEFFRETRYHKALSQHLVNTGRQTP